MAGGHGRAGRERTADDAAAVAGVRAAWLLPALEIGLLCALVASSPGRLERRSATLRVGGLALAGLLSLANATFAVLLVDDLARGGGTRSASELLLAGGALWTPTS